MNLAERTPLLGLGEYHGVFGRVFFVPTYRHTRSLPLAGKSEGTLHGLAGEQQQQQEEERGVENHHFLLLHPACHSRLSCFWSRLASASPPQQPPPSAAAALPSPGEPPAARR